jgi:phosphoglycerate dehydrogenase-like enzyme
MSGAHRLDRFLIRFDLPSGFVDALRSDFPEIDFIVDDGLSSDSDLSDIDAALTWRMSADEVAGARRLQWVQWIGAGVDGAPLHALRDGSILLTNNRGVHAPNIAEHLIMLMLAFTRGLPDIFRAQEERRWAADEGRERARELAGSRVLVVGAGHIGSALAQKATALDVNVTLVGRSARDATAVTPRVLPIDDLDDLLPEADHIAICLPLTSGTHRLFDRARIGRMHSDAYLYNIGRGPVVATNALVDALSSGAAAGAGLDVTDPEPLPPDHPLWTMPNVILTMHSAGATPRYWDRAGAILRENISRFRSGQPMRNLVDYDLGY